MSRIGKSSRSALSRDTPWLLALCASRVGFALIFTTYSAALPLLQSDWEMSASQAGLIQSAWHVGFLISLFSVGFLADRHGAKRVFLITSIAASISALTFAFFADSFVSGLVLHGVTGTCSGGSYTPGLTLIAERFQTGGRGRAMGFYLAAASLGYALSLFLSSGLIPVVGWRGAFIVTACGPLFGTLLAFRVLRHSPNIIHPGRGKAFDLNALLAVWQNRPAMLAIWAYVFHAWEVLGLWAWLPAYLAAAASEGRIDSRSASLGILFTAVTYLVAVGGSITGGALSDRWGRTAVIMLMASSSLACSFLFGWLFAAPIALIVLVAVVYNFTAVADSSIHSTALSELVPPRYLGAAYSLRSVLGFGAGAISPWVFGLVLDWGQGAYSPIVAWGLAWTALGAGAVLGPWVAWQLRQTPEAAQLAHGKR
jgi:MFS family permease